MIIKKITAAVSALAMSAGVLAYMPVSTLGSVATAADSASKYNYAEALQKSMFFYEVQQSGKLPEWNQVAWRADSMVDEDGNETDVVPGGWFDAGDHFKFTLTNAYSASIMAWGYINYKDAVDKAGLGEVYRNNIQWGMDYVMACDKGGGEMIGTIGDFKGGSTDHNIWCSAEVYLRKHHLNSGDWKRPYDTIKNASVAGLSAACLAEGYIIFKDTQPEKAAQYLKHAKDLFEGADKIRANKDIGGMTGMYNTDSWLDDCMYAANWLYIATGDKSYLDKIEKDYIPNFPLENQSTERKFTWGLCWDDTSQAAAFLYALNTGNKEWTEHISHHLDYWIDGYGGKKVDYTPDGLAWLFNWGSARHATTTAWLAKLASDTLFKDDAALSKKYNDWAKSQMDYVFGDNGLKMSYVLGMGDNQPTAFHHRTASGIHDDHWNDLGQKSGGDEGWQTEYAHTLYGALVGGPDKSGSYKNSVAQYEYSEVAIDYNAGYTACLCAMVDDYGGSIDASFPPAETPKWAEWEVAAVINGTPAASYTEIKAWAMNHTAWPARVAKDVEYRYFFDVSEVIENGLSVDDIKVEGKSQQYESGQGHATVTGPHKYEGDPTGNTYYASIKFEDGRAIQPTGQSEHRDEVQFRISIPDAIDGKSTAGAWDTSNDWSYLGGLAKATDLKKADSLNEHMPMYVDGVIAWGEEPDGTKFVAKPCVKNGSNEPTNVTTTTTKPVTTTTTTSTTTTTVTTTVTTTTEGNETPAVTKWGDANCDGEVDFADIVLIMQSLANPNKYGVDGTDKSHITEQGIANGDVYDNGSKLTTNDAQTLQKYLLHVITELPEKK
ncbi:glycoside hydrolase family 9 protein [Ruminococcus flavefaciens]|uniref:glycoside hydrolase family 9 protein n=1 Tax=Ruminococcus flavefaciens TaxID=1265 RepID=UPI00048C8140|nr:glycoside hydrolase family 9 protein [Ruminococcus flavefaciens]